MTKVYSFYSQTGGYESEWEAKRREDGTPILPEAGHESMTGVVPPEPRDGFMRVFDRETQSWSYQENHAGKTVYDKATGMPVMLKLGKTLYPKFGPIPDGYTDKPKPSPSHEFDEAEGEWVEDADIKDRLYRDTVNFERARRIEAGCVVTVAGAGDIPVQGRQEDKDSFTNLCNAAQLRLAAGDQAGPMVFRDAADVIHELTPAEMLLLYSGAMAFAEAVYKASWAIKDTTRPEDPADDAHWPDPVWPQP